MTTLAYIFLATTIMAVWVAIGFFLLISTAFYTRRSFIENVFMFPALIIMYIFGQLEDFYAKYTK